MPCPRIRDHCRRRSGTGHQHFPLVLAMRTCLYLAAFVLLLSASPGLYRYAKALASLPQDVVAAQSIAKIRTAAIEAAINRSLIQE